MEINKIKLEKEFEYFLDSVSSLKNNTVPNLVSISFEIPSIEIATLITSNIARNQECFYWKIADEKIEFLAIRPIINFKELGEDRLAKTSVKVSEIENSFFSNWHDNDILDAPLIVGGIKFAPEQESERWQDFSDSDWFIPEFLFYEKRDKVFLIYNFVPTSNSININKFAEVLAEIENIEIDNTI